MNLPAIQAALRDSHNDCWLFYDHHHRDPIAYHLLGLPEKMMVTRRWFYLIPAEGDPIGLVHRIESHHLDSLPGQKLEYSAWQELWQNLEAMLKPYHTVVMQYSPNNQIPYISLVDAGMLELVRSFGKEIVTSANLVARFEATLTEAQMDSHLKARDAIDKITAAFFEEVGCRTRNGGTHEFEMQQWIMEAFQREDLVTCDPPNVSVNAHSGDPHYEPTSATSARIKQGDFVLLDIWAKCSEPDSVYYDITWTGVIGTPSDKQREVFEIVRNARDVGIRTVQQAFDAKRKICGWEVDQAVREFIASKGYGQYFIHRTGHSIGRDIHANGANLDNLETKDDRDILPNTCFSVEPGIYLPEFGVRSEINMLIRNGKGEVTGRVQNELVQI
ncbi:MAG: M24 family metallopeptidase [Acidobacteriota bacterium]|nr:M24 family metallopeptidase [Acidobacteriota bacterium]